MLVDLRRTWKFIHGALALFAIVFAGFLTPVRADGNVFTDPANFSDWSVIGPNGGDVRVVAIDPRDKNRLYISTADGQVHTSADAGKTWRLLVNLNEPQLVLDQLFVDSRDSKVIYTSGNRGKVAGGFFKSTDGGATWKEAKDLRSRGDPRNGPVRGRPEYSLCRHKDGVWISKDSGDNWSKIDSSTSPVDVNSMAVDPKDSKTIYAGTNWRPYKSTDNGKNWRLIKDGMIDDSDVFAITVDPRQNDHLIASACSGIYESRNGGKIGQRSTAFRRSRAARATSSSIRPSPALSTRRRPKDFGCPSTAESRGC